MRHTSLSGCRLATSAALAACLLAALLHARGPQRRTPVEERALMNREALQSDADPNWIDIMPDSSFKGWTRLSIPPAKPLDAKSQWSVRDRVLVCEGNGGHEWLRWDRELGNFILQAEWRFTPREGETKYNSGVFVRNNADGSLWHQAQTGLAGGWLFGNTLVNGTPGRLNLREQMKENRVRPAGEWNWYDIRCEGRKIALSVNGAVVSEFAQCELPRGYLGFEAEGFRIEFRNLRVKELVPR